MAHLTTGFPLVHPLSEKAVEIVFGTQPDAATRQALMRALQKLHFAPFPGMTDLTPAYTSITVHFDPASVQPSYLKNTALSSVVKQLELLLDSQFVSPVLSAEMETPDSPLVEIPVRCDGQNQSSIINHQSSISLVEIPVRYGGQWGIDLPEAAERLGLTEQALIEKHCGEIYTVVMVGFLPGFPYLGVLPQALQLPRRSTPRPLVPAGSVAIAGQQTGIYPQASPGGWHLIGQTEVCLFDPQKNPPSLLQPGCRVRFVASPSGGAVTSPSGGGIVNIPPEAF